MKWTVIGILMTTLLAAAAPAAAYVGPGAGLSMLGALWGLLVAVLAAVAFVIAWPVRRYLRRKRGHAAGDQSAASDDSTTTAGDKQTGEASAETQGRS